MIGIKDEILGLIVALSARYADQHDTHPVVLYRPDSLAEIPVATKKHRITDSPVLGERHEITVNQGVDALLLVVCV